MMLQRLAEYADRLDLPPTLYAEAAVRYIIELDAEGRLLSPLPVDTANPDLRSARYGERRCVPRVQRTSAVRPLLLADNCEYTLGLEREGSNPTRACACHQAYLEQLALCAQVTGEPAVRAVHAFLSDRPLDALCLPEDYDRKANVTFRVDGLFPTELPAVQAFWAAQHDPDADPEGPAPVMQCLVCGQQRPVLRRLQAKIKGVPGGQPSGTALISANADAFESYGLEASLIAPTCAACGERFTLALNHLLSDPARHTALGGAALVFWTRVEHPFSLLTFLAQPQPQDVSALIEATRRGGPPPPVDETAFYAATLSGSGGRVMVRDWIDTTVSAVKAHLAGWFAGQAIVGEYGDASRPLGIYALAAATVRDAAKDLAPPTLRALWRAALTGTPLPPGVLYQAVRRNRAEQGVTAPRAALIKLVLTCQTSAPLEGASVGSRREDAMAALDSENAHPAYLCGRLLAVIERAQYLAVPGIKATVVDRFFGTASSAPASVFGRLLRGAQPHLAKLRRDRPGAYGALQARLEEIQAGLPAFPRVLSLEEQGIFALGYYHQRAHDRAAAREAAAQRRAVRETADDGAGEGLTDVATDDMPEEGS